MNRIIIFTVLLLSLLNFQAFSQADASGKDKLLIGIKESPPFVIIDGENYSGVSVDLWDEIAGELGYDYEFKEYNLTDLLSAVEANEVNMSINPLTVTAERMQRFDFTQPFYVTNLGIATKYEDKSGIWTFIRAIFSMEFLQAVLLLLFIIFIFGLILWLIERKRNPDQFGKGLKGLGDGLWWSAVTMTTVGYGDKAPITAWGRAFGMIWMFTAIIVISSFTAGIASALTVNQLESNIKGLEDLKTAKVGTIAGSASADFLKTFGIVYREYDDLDKGLLDVEKKNLQAFVYDEAILRYLIQSDKYKEKIIIIPSSYSKEYFSFASKNRKLLEEIDPVLISKIESSLWRDILENYNLDYKEQ